MGLLRMKLLAGLGLLGVVVAVAGTVACAAEASGTTEGPEPAPQRTGLRQLFRAGQQTITLEAAYSHQINFPQGPRSMLGGWGAHLTQMRFRSRRSARGLETGFSSLSGDPASTHVWEILGLQRQYFRITPDYAAFWQIGLGGCYLSSMVPEQGSRLNFTEHLGTGLTWRTGEHTSVTVEGRFKHISNAELAHPNVGINSGEVRLGWDIYF